MGKTNATYLSKLHDLVDRHYGSEEFRTLCFDLGVDFASLGGEGKSSKVREFILALTRANRLQEMVSVAARQRPNVDWPPVPENVELPSPLTSQSDGGDQITVGNISGSGIAIGRGASATVTSIGTAWPSADFGGDNLTIKSRLQAAHQTIGALLQSDIATKDEIQGFIILLNDALHSTRAGKIKQAEEIAEATKLLVEATAAEDPNKTMVKMMGTGLIQAAQGLEVGQPTVIGIVKRIVVAVTDIIGIAD